MASSFLIETYKAAADLYAALRKKGVTLPLVDCVLAALTRQHDATFVTFDGHFEAFGDPTRFLVVERGPA